MSSTKAAWFFFSTWEHGFKRYHSWLLEVNAHVRRSLYEHARLYRVVCCNSRLLVAFLERCTLKLLELSDVPLLELKPTKAGFWQPS